MHNNESLANFHLAFGSGNFNEALKHARKAIQAEPNLVEGYHSAGKACISLEKYSDAVAYFKKAIEISADDGNGYFLLGYAQILSGNTADALKSLTRAVESNCDDALKGQIYKMMSMINTDQGDF